MDGGRDGDALERGGCGGGEASHGVVRRRAALGSEESAENTLEPVITQIQICGISPAWPIGSQHFARTRPVPPLTVLVS